MFVLIGLFDQIGFSYLCDISQVRQKKWLVLVKMPSVLVKWIVSI